MSKMMALYYGTRRRDDAPHDRRNEYSGEMRRRDNAPYDRRNEYGGEMRRRDGMPYDRRNEYEGEMRRRDAMPYDGGNEYGDEMRRRYSPMSGDDGEEYETRRQNDMTYDDGQQSKRQIGFGAEMHSGSQKKGTKMETGSHNMLMDGEMDEQTATEWVRSMRNADRNRPMGGKWTPEDVKPLAMKYGVPPHSEKFWEFFAMMNAMHSDYCEVAKGFGITSPDFYARMAKAWMDDPDAVEGKTAMYYRYIVDHGEE